MVILIDKSTTKINKLNHFASHKHLLCYTYVLSM